MAPGVAYELLRFRTRDGDETTVYLVRHPVAATRVSVRHYPGTARLDHWCAATGRPEAIVAGAPQAPAEPPLLELRPARARVAPDRDRAAVRSALRPWDAERCGGLTA